MSSKFINLINDECVSKYFKEIKRLQFKDITQKPEKTYKEILIYLGAKNIDFCPSQFRAINKTKKRKHPKIKKIAYKLRFVKKILPKSVIRRIRKFYN
jgi:hypothetical protein